VGLAVGATAGAPCTSSSTNSNAEVFTDQARNASTRQQLHAAYIPTCILTPNRNIMPVAGRNMTPTSRLEKLKPPY